MNLWRDASRHGLRLLGGDLRVVSITLATGLAHLAFAGRYGIFGDELYFIVCGRHPDFGYVDQPPLLPLIDAATQVFGPSPVLLRLPAVLAAMALVPLTADFARRLGGSRGAALLAAIGVALAPILTILTSITATWTFEPIFWTLAAYLLARAVIEGDRRFLLWAGLIGGISLEAKYGILFWALGLGVGLLLTPARMVFRWRSLWVGLALGTVVAVPSFVWQQLHGWPFLDIMRQHQLEGSSGGTLRHFVLAQIVAMNPVLAPLWLAGIVAPFCIARLAPARFLSIGFLVTSAAIYLAGGRFYYLVAVYPAMIAIGSVACIGLGRRLLGAWIGVAATVVLVLSPALLPILDPASLAAYFRALPFDAYTIGTPLGIVFSWELGWPDLERRVAAAYSALPEGERKLTAIFADNFGEAAAIDFYGVADRLPPVISGHNQYYLWGPGGDPRTIIAVNSDPARWRQSCGSVESVGSFGVPFGHPMETDRPIVVCHGYQGGLAAAWPLFKTFH